MLKIDIFTFNPFRENTYVLSDDTKQCVIIDPGCYENHEKLELSRFLEKNELIPTTILLTHSHIDHVLGIAYLVNKYNLSLEMNEIDLPGLRSVPVYAQNWGINAEVAPEPTMLLNEGDTIGFGNTTLDVIFTPGHSPGSLCFYHKESKTLISGDVLFQESIGRTDLPGGDHNALLGNIKEKLFPLGDDVKVYPGHGPATTIGYEKINNPFLR
jgi:glyoxylase-like metal-dependent hydrolase (beta-lactamase superfamily II)